MGTQNIGTLISSAVRPNNTDDRIASAYAVEVKGGHHTYAALASRDGIIEERREWGMLCTVYNDGGNNGTYQLKYGNFNTTITDNRNWVRFAGSGSGSGAGSGYWQDPVLSVLSAQPGSPSSGDRYLLGSSLTGPQWSSLSPDLIVQWDSTLVTWTTTAPLDGMSLRVNNVDNSFFRYEGTYPTGSWKVEKVNQVSRISATSSDGVSFYSSSVSQFAYDSSSLYFIQFATSNSGSSFTLNLNGLGAKTVKQQTGAGLITFAPKDINPNISYPVQYDGTYFRLSKPSSDPSFVKYRILPGESVSVPAYQEYLLYGNLEVNGNLNIDPNGKVVLVNGALNLNGGTVSNAGNVSMVTFGNGGGSVVNKFTTTLAMTGGTTYSVAHNLGTPAYTFAAWDETNGGLLNLSVAKTSGMETTNVDVYSASSLSNVRVVVVG